MDATIDRVLRPALLAAAVFNFAAALAFALPTSVGRLVALPAVPALYTLTRAAFIALFGGSYAWMATRPILPPSMLAFGAIGKTVACALFFTLWLGGEASTLLMLGGLGDLAFAALFFAALQR